MADKKPHLQRPHVREKLKALFPEGDMLLRECFAKVVYHALVSQRRNIVADDSEERFLRHLSRVVSMDGSGLDFAKSICYVTNARLGWPYPKIQAAIYNRALRNSPMPPIPDGDLELAAAVAVLQDRLWPKRGRRRT
jgi:hypothetical protein